MKSARNTHIPANRTQPHARMAFPVVSCRCAFGSSECLMAPDMIDEPAMMMALAAMRLYSNPVIGAARRRRKRSRRGVSFGMRGSRLERPSRSCCQTIRKPEVRRVSFRMDGQPREEGGLTADAKNEGKVTLGGKDEVRNEDCAHARNKVSSVGLPRPYDENTPPNLGPLPVCSSHSRQLNATPSAMPTTRMTTWKSTKE